MNQKMPIPQENSVLQPVSISSVPSCVYRLQFNKQFTFKAATALIPYFKELGVDALYCSPYLQAAPGSMHGYNITNPNKINPEIGTEEEFEFFCAELDRCGIRQILDIVPNHMGISTHENLWWRDVLENGPASLHAPFFDIDWDPVKKEIQNKVLLPFLGDHYGTVLENEEIKLFYREGQFEIHYFETVLPVTPGSYPFIMTQGMESLEEQLSSEDETPLYLEYLSILTGFQRLPSTVEKNAGLRSERNREKEILKKRLSQLAAKSPVIKNFIETRLNFFNGQRGIASSFDLLDTLLNQQCYRLSYWRVASEEINYRRFFDINELAAIRIEDRTVFEQYHELIFKLIHEGKIHGLRIDHPDGLYDPREYFRRLQQAASKAAGLPDMEDSETSSPFYIVVEKILERKETLPADWQVHGTVGYEYMNILNNVFVKRENEGTFDEVYENFIGRSTDVSDLIAEKKNIVALIHMASEINALGNHLDLISERQRRFRDFTRNNLTLAIREVIACFPVYRTYISAQSQTVTERDRKHITIAVEKAKSRTPFLNAAVYDFLKKVLLLEWDDSMSEEDQQLYKDFVLRFQQLTGPIMAKGLEDTAFYIYNRLLSLNEVGADPGRFGASPEEFHSQNIERNKQWPYSFLASSTHDSKRSEDVRFRLNVLSEIPEEWKGRLEKWSFVNKKHKTQIGENIQPGMNLEYLIYQTLLGAWPGGPLEPKDMPALGERFWGYCLKSIREAKVHTSWTDPKPDYEGSVKKFVTSILAYETENHFLIDFLSFQERIAAYGLWNSLSALVLKLGSPGVADFYQGCDLWNYSLVDPDNRRPVDYELREKFLEEMKRSGPEGKAKDPILRELIETRYDGRLKLWVTWKGLNFRKENPELFLNADYRALKAEGFRKNNIIAFAREKEGRTLISAASRFFTELLPEQRLIPAGEEIWKETELLLPPQWGENLQFENILTGETLKSVSSGPHQVLRGGDLFQMMSAALLSLKRN